MFIKVLSDNEEIKRLCYEPLQCGEIYKAEYLNKYYTTVFYTINDVEYEIDVHNRHLVELTPDEVRDWKLNKIGI